MGSFDRNLSGGSSPGDGSHMGALVGFTPLENWTVQNVEEWLISVGLKSASKQFVENGGAVQVESGCDA